MFFTIIDTFLNKDLTDLVLSFLYLDCIDFSLSTHRIYHDQKDAYGMKKPSKPFYLAVWHHRYMEPCLPSGIKLEACRILKCPSYSTLLQIFTRLELPSHYQCNNGFRANLNGEPLTDSQAGFIKDHWISDWFPKIFRMLKSIDEQILLREGLSVVIASMFSVCAEYCDELDIYETTRFLKSSEYLDKILRCLPLLLAPPWCETSLSTPPFPSFPPPPHQT